MVLWRLSSLPKRTSPVTVTGGGRSWRVVAKNNCSRVFVINNYYGHGSVVGGRRSDFMASSSSRAQLSYYGGGNGGGIAGGRSYDNRGGMFVYDSLSMSHKPLNVVVEEEEDYESSSVSILSSSSSSCSPPHRQRQRGVAWYICGPTVYDSAHVGHGRTYVTLDILRRVAMHYNHGDGPGLLYAMNITDVDDKIIKRSAMIMRTSPSPPSAAAGAAMTNPKLGDPIALARHYESEFWSDMDQLNVLRPNVICRVSEHVESTIVPYVAQILEGGMAYVVHEEEEAIIEDGSGDSSSRTRSSTLHGSVYFDVRAFESKARGRTRYGKLAPSTTDTISNSNNGSTTFFSWEKRDDEVGGGKIIDGGNGGVDNDDDGPMVQRMKRDPRDFCLWKYRPRTGSTRKSSSSSTRATTLPNDDEANGADGIIEPESVSYNSPWGPGRPGWHVECSAMIHQLSRDFLDTHVFAMHAGGIDLRFPHHTNEIAQAEAHCMAGEDGTKNSGDDGTNINGHMKEWIPHWLHTGHLHVKGRKMSKSLKNFITIREMLQLDNDQHDNSDDNNAWHSPTDDFRLWCLGLSGSYRGPATYGKDRMEEARSVREKWIRFLIEGQECLEERMEKSPSSSSSCTFSDDSTMADKDVTATNSSTRLWGDADLSLFRAVARASVKCRAALMDDLDGATFVKELTQISETGLAYIRQAMLDEECHSTKHHERRCQRPEEPLRYVLDFVRFQLNLVGFTPRTVNAGLVVSDSAKISPPLLDEAVAFRAAVRSTALNAIRQKEVGGSVDALKDILGLCDELRDNIFPKFGVEILDGKIAMKEDGDSGSKRGWRHCPPRGSTTTNA